MRRYDLGGSMGSNTHPYTVAKRLTVAQPRNGNGATLVKRTLDVTFAGAGLVASLPLWIAIALAIKYEDGGPVFYRQERVGLGGRAFQSRKFRSMVTWADAEFGPRQAREADPRVTRVGRFLRATALDELPQLWNIFRGDMSFVGPRPLMPEEVEVNGTGESVPISRIPGYAVRHAVRPGLTGLAQVYAPRDIPRRYKFQYDLLYIQNRSLRLDLKLIALSFWVTLRGKWESRGKKI
jgi:lipopolysaccharide/colanic/teichoic acid biosynthesis glycosyltransferase